MKKVFIEAEKSAINAVNELVDLTDIVTAEVSKQVNSYIAPVRKSALKRFPVTFSLLATFGLSTTYYGFEKILSQYDFLNQNPWFILLIGIAVLTFTGLLYKKIS